MKDNHIPEQHVHTTPESPHFFNERSLVRILRHVARSVAIDIGSGLIARGYDDLRPGHLHLFEHLDMEGTNIVTLAQRAKVSKQAMSRIVKEVEKAGYVFVASNPFDNRAILVKFTEKGFAYLKHVNEEMRRSRTDLFEAGVVTQTELNQSIDTMLKILRFLEVKTQNVISEEEELALKNMGY